MMKSISEKIFDMRIRHTKRLLIEEPMLSIENIARTAGFSTDSYFCKAFRKRYGVTPSEYRKNKRREKTFDKN
jgi:AraC-like DNA-binding protein